MTCSLLTIANGATASGTFAAGGCASMARGAAYNAAYYQFVIPAGGANMVDIALNAVTGQPTYFYYPYIFLRSGNAANTVGGVSGFGADPVLYSEAFNGPGNNADLHAGVDGFNGALNAGIYTIECTTYYSGAGNGYGSVGPYTLALSFNSTAPIERGSSQRAGTRSRLLTPLGEFGYPVGSRGESYLSSPAGNRDTSSPDRLTSSARRIVATGPSIIQHYQMRGRDADAAGVVYRTWTVTGSPDTTGVLYTGPKSGLTPLQNIVVTSSWIT